jgi:carbonic anhydrase/acetyltransferase-like protein (isoleucine patch superfamily)
MNICTFKNIIPNIDKDTYLAPGSQIIGMVTIGKGSSVWHNAVLRGDMNSITIGENTNIQDNSVVHVDSDHPTVLGDNVTVGHGAIVHGCKIGNNVLIGMNATVLDGAEIGDGSIIGANALVSQGKIFPPKSLILGVPAKAVKELSDEEVEGLKAHAEKYKKLWQENY